MDAVSGGSWQSKEFFRLLRYWRIEEEGRRDAIASFQVANRQVWAVVVVKTDTRALEHGSLQGGLSGFSLY